MTEAQGISKSIDITYSRLFLRFLRFGLLAWGGPVAQIAMIRHELVEQEGWISSEHFNRVLAVYQALPGPEAHEMCVYFGMIARGRLGGLLAGLGFMLPGFVLILLLSWIYMQFGMVTVLTAAFFGMQPAVVALVARAVQRIGIHALANRWLTGIAVAAGVLQLLNVNFLITLLGAALAYILVKRDRHLWAFVLGIALIIGALFMAARPALPEIETLAARADGEPSLAALAGTGLSAGLLTFGGAYTAIPLVRHEAVIVNGWLTDAQFLDGLALGGILPAPLIIFGTFVGYAAAGLAGALVMTAGIFTPAFAFTLVGHEYLERAITNKALHNFLDGITAGVVGLIAAVLLTLARSTLTSVPAVLICGAALLVLYRWKSKLSVPVVVLGAGLLGLLLYQG